MSKIDIKKASSATVGLFFREVKSGMTIDDATKLAIYNGNMVLIKDVLAWAATQSSLAKFAFTGFVGNITLFFASLIIKAFVLRGVNIFTIDVAYKWYINQNKKIYIINMKIHNKEIDLKESLTDDDKKTYKDKIKASLKEFFNLSKYLK